MKVSEINADTQKISMDNILRAAGNQIKQSSGMS